MDITKMKIISISDNYLEKKNYGFSIYSTISFISKNNKRV